MADKRLQDWISEHRSRMIDDIAALVAIESVSDASDDPLAPFGNGCRRVLDEAVRICADLGFSAHDHEHQCVTFCWEGADKEAKTIGLFGHLDVVPAGGDWSCDPFCARVEEDRIIGRGSSDNKGAVVALLYALAYLRDSGFEPENSIRVFLGSNEEDGMEDIPSFIERFGMPDLSLVPDVAFPVCYGEKGMMHIIASNPFKSEVLLEFSAGVAKNAVPGSAAAVLKLSPNGFSDPLGQSEVEFLEPDLIRVTTKGIAAHSAFPQGSVNAEVRLAEVLLASGVLDEPARELMNSICLLFSDYHGGGLDARFEDQVSGKLTHIASMARLSERRFIQHINIRYPIQTDRDELSRRVKKVLAGRSFMIDSLVDSPPSFYPPDDPLVGELTSIASRHLGRELSPYIMGGGTYARKLERAIGFGPGNPLRERRFGTDRGGAHQPDEYVELEDLILALGIYVEAIGRVDELI